MDEEAGTGVTATVDGHRVSVGTLNLPDDAPGWARSAHGRAVLDGAAVAWVTVDDRLTGAILLIDPVRRDASRTLRRLRAAGLNRLVMLTGDRREPAEEIGAVLGLDAVRAEQSPADKVAGVRAERERAVTVMVGDGVNDDPPWRPRPSAWQWAPAVDGDLRGGGRRAHHGPSRPLADAMAIARRSRRIAVQSAAVGMGLSLVAMGFAAFACYHPRSVRCSRKASTWR